MLKQKWQQINFHTYTPKSDKKRTYVIKGLHNYADINEIKHDLKAMGYKVANINPMRNTKQTKYMVTFLENMQIKQLSQLAKYICNTKIIWEHYINKRITQCRRCQGWEHATINCYAEPACLKCAEGHLTKDCKKPIELPAKCVNCGLNHPANATICQNYQIKLKIIENRNKFLQQNTTNIAKSTRIKTAPDLNDRRQYPNLNHVAKYQRSENTTQQHSHGTKNHLNYIQQDHYNNNNNIEPDVCTRKEITETPAMTSYSEITSEHINRNTQGNNSIISHNEQNNVGEFLDFISLTNEIRELTKIINIKKMLTAVREFKSQLQHCNTSAQKFQLLIQFCDKLDNE